MHDWLDRTAWPWPARYADVGDGRMHYVDVGEGPVVLLSHGTPTWAFEWRHVIGALSRTHRVIAPDHLGFGLSERPAGAGYRPEDHAVRFRRFVDGLALDRFSLVVHDYGGPIALGTAIELADRVDHLAVLNSFLWSFEDDRAMWWTARLAGTALFRWLYAYASVSLEVIAPSAWGDRSKLTPEIQAQYRGPWPDPDGRARVQWKLAEGLLGSSAMFEDLWARRDALRAVPTLLAWGMKDSAFRPYHLDKWRAGFPHASVVEIPDAGHWPHEEAPAVVIAALIRHLGAHGVTRLRTGSGSPPR